MTAGDRNSGAEDADGPSGSPPRPASAPGRDPWIRFALTFGALAVLSEIVYFGVALDSQLFQTYLATLARISGWILGHMTEGITVRNAVITGDLFSVEIARGCDAYRICALLCSAIIAFPSSLRLKVWGLALGLLWLNALNFVRIVSLYFIGGLLHEHFKASHEIYFPIFLICMTVLAWIVWVRRAARELDLEPDSA